MSAEKIKSPFCSATVVVADDYVDTFPQPGGLVAFLSKLCLRLGVDVVSLERPVTVKGSWTTIIKIDAFLKTLNSSLHNTISEGALPEEEEDLSAAFVHFEEDETQSNSRSELLVCRDTTQTGIDSSNELLSGRHTTPTGVDSNDLRTLKTDDFLEVIKTDEDNVNSDATVLDKWYFNSNPRGKTIDKRRTFSSSGKTPPEPYVILETDDASKVKQASLVEIEQVLSQVYKKETIEKYQKKSFCSDKQSQETVVLGGVDSPKEINTNDVNSYKKTLEPEPLKEQIDTDTKSNILMDNCSLHSLGCVTDVTLESESERFEPISHGYKEKKINSCGLETPDMNFKSSEPRRTTRQTNSEQNKTAESINRSLIVHKNEKKQRRGRRKRKNDRTNTEEVPQTTNHKVSKPNTNTEEVPQTTNHKVSKPNTNTEEVPQTTNHKVSKPNTNIKEKLHQSSWKSPRRDNKAATQHTPHQASGKETKNVSKLKEEIENVKEKSENCLTKNKIKGKTGLKRCKYVEKKSKEMRNHQRREAEVVHYKCDLCPYLTTKQLQLLEHKRRIHLTKKFRCEECLKEFGFRKDLRRHMKCHRKADNCCDMCGKMYKEVRKLIEHKRIHADDYVKPEFPCKFCAKKFSTKYVLAYHIKSDHLGMKRSYVCPTCGKRFSQKNSYIQHANVHLGIKPFPCEICGKKFSYEKSLKEHKFMHNEKKVFSCDLCHKSFRQASGLAIHLKVHKTTKDYVCSMCGKGFTQKQALVRHERIHGGDKPYECGLCKRTFADSSVLRRHMILIHKSDPKLWQQDTKCHIPKRSDFFISVLNENSLHSNGSEVENSEQTYSKKLEQREQNNCWQEENKQQGPYEQSQPIPDHVETIIPGHFDNVTMENMKSSFTALREPVITEAGNYTEASCTDMKPCIGYVLEKDVATDRFITSMNAATNHHVDTGLFPSSSLYNHSTLPVHSSIAIPTHCVRSVVAHPHHSPTAVHPSQSQPPPASNSSSFSPVMYQQSPVNYDTSNIQMVPYSTMVAQPYSHTIVVHQDSFAAIAYQQPGINTNFSHDNHHHISPSITLSSSPGAHVMDISKVVTSASSEEMYDRILSTCHQHSH